MSEQSSRANEQDDLRLQHYQQYPEEQRAEVFVPRSNKENPAQPIIEGGWMTVGEGYDDSGNLRVHVQKEMLAEDGTPLGTVAEKDVPKSLLEKLQEQMLARELGATALLKSVAETAEVYQPMLTEKQRRVFAPQPHVASAAEQSYDHLFNADAQQSTSVEDAAVREDERWKVTTESRAYAEDALRRAGTTDITVRSAIMEYMQQKQLASFTEAIDAIRTDEALRYKLAEHYVTKLDEHADEMPERVRTNSAGNLKNPNYRTGAYTESMRSRDYVVLLALSKIDGTFRPDREDEIAYNPDGSVGLGQHRSAADQILFST